MGSQYLQPVVLSKSRVVTGTQPTGAPEPRHVSLTYTSGACPLAGGVTRFVAPDWKATIRDRSMEETAIAAVAAGADWMLVSANGVGKIEDMSIAIAGAVARGDIAGDQIAKSAAKVRALAERLDRQRADAN